MELKLLSSMSSIPSSEMKYYICPSCKRPIRMEINYYESKEIVELYCPFCKEKNNKNLFQSGLFFDNNAPYENIIKIQFGKSKSFNYHKARTIAKRLPNYCENNSIITCATNNIIEYCQNHVLFDELCNLVHNWNSAKIFYYDKIAIHTIDYQIFIERTKYNAKEYCILLDNATHDKVTFENLPYPYVYYPPIYGAFFAFAEKINSDLYFCECEREAIENFFEIRANCPLEGYTGIRINPLDGAIFPKKISLQSKEETDFSIKFKENLCFKCNKIIPREDYCNSMYGGVFEQKHGWYIQQEYLKNGIDPTRKHLGVILNNKCDIEIKKRVDIETKLLKTNKNSKEYQILSQELNDVGSSKHYINDKVRTEFGYRGIGEHWVNETMLKHIVTSIFPQYTILVHHRPEWLEGLELDIYVPNIKLAFEYQGIQHFKAVKHWGGKKQLLIQKEHDYRKKMICDKLGITIIYFDYTEEITTEYVRAKIMEYKGI